MNKPGLSKAITEFRNQIEKKDYAKLGGKGNYLTVPYRLKFIRDYFGERISIQSECFECSDNMFRFKANIFLDNQLISVGESKQNIKKDKEFEKQQTVAIGRGLSFAGFFGDEIATAEEMEQFLKPSKPVVKPNLKVVTTDKNFVDDWISKMNEVAKYAKSQNDYEKRIMPLREEYQTELHQISTDLVSQQRIDDAESKLKQQINMRYE
tara:strand:+ start:608 stop:1234 length:627 start_codon:yes stop_codon:yes gene_type:complete